MPSQYILMTCNAVIFGSGGTLFKSHLGLTPPPQQTNSKKFRLTHGSAHTAVIPAGSLTDEFVPHTFTSLTVSFRFTVMDPETNFNAYVNTAAQVGLLLEVWE